jgi:glycosyltransferase involved in cell wall biosynthesis
MKIAFITNLAEEVVFRKNLLFAIRQEGHEVVACVSNLSSAKSLAAANEVVRCCVARLDRTGTSVFGDAVYLLDLVRFVRQEKPQIVFNRALKPVIYGSIAGRLTGVGDVCSLITGLGYAFLGSGWKQKTVGRIARALYRLALAGNKHVFFQNPDDLLLFSEWGIVRGHTRAVLLNGAGVDLDRFQPVPLPEGCVTFLFVGRLLRDKGVYEYIEAAKTLRAMSLQARYVLIGAIDSNPASVKPDELKCWVGEGIVEWHGHVEDIRPWLTRCTVFVLPSYREGSPRAVLEAMAMARPVVTTRVPGCQDTVDEGVNGFLVSARDPDSLVHAMAEFILRPELAQYMGANSRRIACERYDVRLTNKVILETLGLRGQRGALARECPASPEPRALCSG